MPADTLPEEPPQWQYDAHNEYFYKLCDLKTSLQREALSNTAILTPELMSSLSILVLDDLNIDEESPLDFAPSFFSPLPKAKLDEFLATYMEHLHPLRYDGGANMIWRRPCGKPSVLHCEGDCKEEKPKDIWNFSKRGCCAAVEAEQRARWATHMYKNRYPEPERSHEGICMLANWTPTREASFKKNYIEYRGFRTMPCVSGETHYHHPESCFSCEDLSGLVPHTTSMVTEPCVFAATDVLLTDVITAVELLRHQVRYYEHVSHRILPVLLLSFQHDTTARIVQMHFDGQRIFIRQSRLLDLDADEPTEDAYLLLRWMASRPQGDTKYAASACTDDAPMAVATRGPENPSAPIAVHS